MKRALTAGLVALVATSCTLDLDLLRQGIGDAGVDSGVDSGAIPDGAVPDAAVDSAVPDGGTDAGAIERPSCDGLAREGCGLVEITGGSLTMGQDGALSATPEQIGVEISDFRVDSHEVTVFRFRRFWEAGAPAPPVVPIPYPGGDVGWIGPGAEPNNTSTTISCNWSATAGARESHPINCIDLWTAQAFCVWDGGRIPTEAETEWIGRGRAIGGLVAGRSFPWGDTDPSTMCDRAQWNSCAGDDGGSTRRVGSFAAAEGVHDLSGNVSEWMVDRFSAYGTSPCWTGIPGRDPLCTTGMTATIRGGNYATPTVPQLRAASRSGRHMADNAIPGIGFRCVYAP